MCDQPGERLAKSWLNSDPEGAISLSLMDKLMNDCFPPTFSMVLVELKKSSK